MRILLLFLIIGIIGVECSIYFVIPSDLTGNYDGNMREVFGVFFVIVPVYFIVWCLCVCKYTYAKENPDVQWSRILMVLFGIVFQIAWFIVLSYFRNRVSFAFGGLTACVSFLILILHIYEINNVEVKIFFLIVTGVIAGLIMWVSLFVDCGLLCLSNISGCVRWIVCSIFTNIRKIGLKVISRIM